MPVLQEDLYDAQHPRAVDMAARREPYRGMSCREVYQAVCRQHGCKVNSGFAGTLSNEPGVFNLESIDVSQNLIGPKGVVPLLEVARLSSTLTSINLSHNYLDNGALRSVNAALKDHPTLEVLELAGNPLSWTAGMHILDLVSTNRNIQHVGVDGTFLKPNIIETIRSHTTKNQARSKVTGANPTNHPLAIRLRALKRMFREMVAREGVEGKVPKRCAVDGYKENMRMQSREDELDVHSVVFYEDLKRRCRADEMGMIDWPAFMIISMVDDIGYDDAEVAQIKTIFEKYDTDMNGYIDLRELASMMTDLHPDGVSPTRQQLRERMELFDADGSNTLTFDEFVIMMVDKGAQIGSTALMPLFPPAQKRSPHF